jgi:hypothetical protein
MEKITEDKLDELVDKIIKIRTHGLWLSNQKDGIRLEVKCYATEMLNLFKNITETSLQQDDFDKRIHDLCIQFGITKSGDKFY